ncbi:BnaC03g29880D [Brassica napus]|uniref:BnaC03g29880D protein n=1 Tax=Brassica napus TaxID=3708 RepID=A0A078G7C5_BRANA|nr:BnaC03g29880D [Brassica napus]
MGKFPGLMIILASSLLFFLQTLEPATAATLRIAAISSLLLLIKSSLTAECTLSQYPNKVYALGLCARGFKSKACLSCLERLTLETQRDCPNIMDSFVWGSDDEDRVSCLVRSSNHSFGNLELSPPVTGISPDQIEPSINMTLFMQQWEYTVNNTLVAATKANTSSVHKYYSAVKAEFTAFPNVYMLTQCTPDITSQDCKQCLEACLKYFREQFRGRTGGMLQEKGSSIPNKKGRSMHRGIITIIVVFTFFNLVVFIGFYKVKSWTRKLNNGTNGKCTLILAPVKLYNDLLG